MHFIAIYASEITAVSTAVYALAVCLTILWVVRQFREIRSARRAEAIQWVYQIYTADKETLEAVRFVRTLGVSTWQEFKRDHMEKEYHLRKIMQLLEYLGMLHYSRAIDKSLLFGFFGDLIEVWGTRLGEIARGRRDEFRYPVGPIFGEYVFREWRKWLNERGREKLRDRTVRDWPLGEGPWLKEFDLTLRPFPTREGA